MSPPRSNSVVHLELHTGDLPGAVSFFGQLCGWRTERIQAGSGSYLALGMGRGVGGGVVECGAGHPLWVPYVEVPDIGATTDRAEELGAEVLLDSREGPTGWRSIVAAPAGGEVAFWQPKPSREGARRA
jgi:uncharacterized protein